MQDYHELLYQQQLAAVGGISNGLGGFPHQNGGFSGSGSGSMGLQNGSGFQLGGSGALALPGADGFQQLQALNQQQRQPDFGEPAGFSLSGFSAPMPSAAGGMHGHALDNGFGTDHSTHSQQQQRQMAVGSWKPERYGATSWPLRDPPPAWGMLTEGSQLEVVAAALDERGERDAALLATLQKRCAHSGRRWRAAALSSAPLSCESFKLSSWHLDMSKDPAWRGLNRPAHCSCRLPEVGAAIAEGPSAIVFSDSDGEAPAAAPVVRQSRRIAGPDGDDGRGGSAGSKGRPGSGASHDAMLRGGVLLVSG